MKFLGVAAILAIVATVSFAQDCENNDNVFTYNTKNGEKSTTCRELYELSSESQEGKCTNSKISNKCPSVCDADCDDPEFSCVNFVGKFYYEAPNPEKGTIKMTCDKAANKGPEIKCKKIEIATNCPVLCYNSCADIDIDACSNFATEFSYNPGKKGNEDVEEKITTCEKIASLSNDKIKKKCKKREIKKNCPGVCDSSCAAE